MQGELMHFEILVEDRSGKKALDVMNNTSPSFCYFRDKLRELAGVME
jgi:hypothetical protein